jgi:DNA-binding transcriptional ArsR family regulator
MLLERPHSIELQAKLFRGLADPSRLAILTALRWGPLSVGEIVAQTELSQPNVSNHLRCLSECGLVVGLPQGRFVHYRLSDTQIERMLRIADELLEGRAKQIDRCRNYRNE